MGKVSRIIIKSIPINRKFIRDIPLINTPNGSARENGLLYDGVGVHHTMRCSAIERDPYIQKIISPFQNFLKFL